METTWVHSVLGLLWWWFLWTFLVTIFYLEDNPEVTAKVLLDIVLKGFVVAFVAYAALLSLMVTVETVEEMMSFLFG